MLDDVIALFKSLPPEGQHMLWGFYNIEKSGEQVLKVKEILDELEETERTEVLTAVYDRNGPTKPADENAAPAGEKAPFKPNY